MIDADVGDLIQVVWFDHVSHAPWHEINTDYAPARCTSWGSLIEVHETYIVVAGTVIDGDARDRTVGDAHVLILSACESIKKVTVE